MKVYNVWEEDGSLHTICSTLERAERVLAAQGKPGWFIGEDDTPSAQVIQIMPAPGWRVFRCWAPKDEFEEFPAVGWALDSEGFVELLVATDENGMVMSINDANRTHRSMFYEKFFDRAPNEAEKKEMAARAVNKRDRKP